MMRCNCDASCGENRYHDVGSFGCRFGSEREHDAYWARQYGKWPDLKNHKEEDMFVPQKTVQDEWDALIRVQTQEMLEKFKEDVIQSGPTSMNRPWGSWHVLDVGKGYKVKRLEILVDQAISMQYHNHRSELWTIVQGEGKAIVHGDIFTVSKGDTFFVPKETIHKITNISHKETLIAIEVQMGDICEESDIIRV